MITTSEWILRARLVHGDRYGYSKSVYNGAKTKLIIICNEHGEFPQIPDVHVNSKGGCKECGLIASKLKQRGNNDSFIKKSNVVHNNYYDYSLVKYKNNRSMVKIICPVHDVFTQTAAGHLSGKGCTDCAIEEASKRYMDTKEQFISKAKAVHGDKFDYSEVEYTGNKNKITLTCNTCKSNFSVAAGSHVSGIGCGKCIGLYKSTEEWIAEAKLFHGDKYNYDKSIYTGAIKKLIITCAIHKDFEQAARKHSTENGCPSCTSSGFDSKLPATLYYLRVETRNQLCYKIGITNRTVKKRYTVSDMEIITVLSETFYPSGIDAKDEETRIKRKYKHLLYTGEPILKSVGISELFTTDVLLLDDHGIDYNTPSLALRRCL